jgi:hypothetical protein
VLKLRTGHNGKDQTVMAFGMEKESSKAFLWMGHQFCGECLLQEGILARLLLVNVFTSPTI